VERSPDQFLPGDRVVVDMYSAPFGGVWKVLLKPKLSEDQKRVLVRAAHEAAYGKYDHMMELSLPLNREFTIYPE